MTKKWWILKVLKIIISGGGTGGHLFPAIAIGEEMILNGYNVKFIGSKKGFDAKYLKDSKHDYKLLDIYGYNSAEIILLAQYVK